MILKGSQRGGGQDLAAHLIRTDDNEHVRLHELRGFASDNLKDAFKEIEAISRGTKCEQYLFSLSLSPPEGARVDEAAFEDAIDRAEERLGLEGQPRAIVFHEKEGRRHAHCVWSRIDVQTMTARHHSFFKTKLMGLSRELFLEHGWKLPSGIEELGQRNPLNFSLAEWQQAKRQGVDPRWVKDTIQSCWNRSDGRVAFERGLEEYALFLARGDKRGFVVLDHNGEVYSLSRMLGVKKGELRERLKDESLLPDVDAVKAVIGRRMSSAIRRHVEESRGRFRKRSATLIEHRAAMTELHRDARVLLTMRHQDEWDRETKARADRLPKGLMGLWHRLTGKYQEVRRFNQAEAVQTRERQAAERQALVEKQLEERAVLQAKFTDLRRDQAEQLRELRRDVGRYLRFSRCHEAPARGLETGLSLRLGQ